MRRVTLLLTTLCTLSCFEVAFAVRVPQTAPKALKDTQEKSAVAQHQAAAEADKGGTAIITEPWITQIQQMVAAHSKRDDKPAETFRVTFKKNGTLAKWVAEFPRNAKRTPNDANQDHDVSRASFEAKTGKVKIEAETKVEGPD